MTDAETRLRAAVTDEEVNRLLPAIFDNVADGVTVLDRKGTLRFANAAAARMMGFDRAAEVIGQSSQSMTDRFDLLDNDGRPFDLALLPTRRALAGETEPEAMIRFRSKGTDQDRWSMVRARMLSGDGDETDLVITSFQDVTAIKKAEQRLSFSLRASAILGETGDYHDSLSRLAWLVVPTVADWCVFDVLGVGDTVERVAAANADAEKMRLSDEIERRWPPDLNHPSAVKEVLQRRHTVHVREVTEDMLLAGARDEEHLSALKALGVREAVSVPLVGRGHVFGALTVGHSSARPPLSPEDLAMIEDLGRRAGAAVDAAMLLEESQEALRLQEEFMAVTSHDMRTPLAAVRGYAQLARRHLSGEQQDLDAVDRWLGDIDDGATRLTSLVSEFMDVTLLRAGDEVPLQIQPTDLVELVKERVREHQGASETHEFRVKTPTDSVVGNWDEARIGRVLDNVLGNAAKFSPDGGTIEVELNANETDATMAISDAGIGIAPQDLSRIFLPMYRGANARGVAGTGLGLAGSRRLVELMGGHIAVKSRLGKGSTFTVVLPLAGPDQETPTAQ